MVQEVGVDRAAGAAAGTADAQAAPVRAAGRRVARASDQRRRRAERQLHDGVQQHIALMGLKLSMLRQALPPDSDAARAVCEEISADLASTLRELRSIAFTLYPAVLDNEGLLAALRATVAQLDLPGGVEQSGPARYDPAVETAVYFCCLEALRNVVAHAGPTAEVAITMAYDVAAGELTFTVRDDGRGFDPAAPTTGAGLQHIADRLLLLSGELSVQASPGAGARLIGRLPATARGS